MRKIYLLALLMGILAVGQAQSFIVTPSLVVDTDVDPRGTVDVYIHFTNTNQLPLTLQWEPTNSSYPSGWFMSLCDNEACYSLPHGSETMAAVTMGDSAFLKITCVPMEITGTGTLSYHVYDVNNVSDAADVTFNFNVQTATAITSSQMASQFSVSPSPASEVLHLTARNGMLDKGNVVLMNLQGQTVLAQNINAVQSADIRVADLAPGAYFLRYDSKTGSMTQKVVVAH
jgi:hypothetical protein